MRSTRFHIVNLGCKVNRVEADTMTAALLAQGAESVAEEAADLIIVNTCTVTGEAEKKTRKAVHHALAVNPVADVLVTGCAAAISAETFLSMSPRVQVSGKDELLKSLNAESSSRLRIGDEFRTRVGVKVQDGCDRACTYCIVHVARGKARSVASPLVIEEARAHFDAGVKEIVLAGIDIGAYRDGDTGLATLATKLLAEADASCGPGETPARIRISSIEPLSVDEGLVDVLAHAQGRLCRHLHVPLQSGSTKVLREMNRPYTAEEFLALVQHMRATIPELSLSTDVIVGFPGETDDDFEETCDLVSEAGFSRLHVFPYSMREGTPAATREDQIDPEVKRERAARLRKIGTELNKADLERRKGSVELCIIEDDHALTESYHEIPAPPDALMGSLIPLEL